MNYSEIIQTICGGSFSILIYVMFFWMFYLAIFKKDFTFHGGRIHGQLARILGIIGMLGITAGGYLAISYLVFHTEPPLMPVAAFLFALFGFMAIGVRFLSGFFGLLKTLWHLRK